MKGEREIAGLSAEVEEVKDERRRLAVKIEKLESEYSVLSGRLAELGLRVELERSVEFDLLLFLASLCYLPVMWGMSNTALTSVYSLPAWGAVLVAVIVYVTPSVLCHIGIRLAGAKRWLTMAAAAAIYAAVVIRLAVDAGKVATSPEPGGLATGFYITFAILCAPAGFQFVHQIWVVLPVVWRRLKFYWSERRIERVERRIIVAKVTLPLVTRRIEAMIGALQATKARYAEVNGFGG